METREYSLEELRGYLQVFEGGAKDQASTGHESESDEVTKPPVELHGEDMRVYRGEAAVRKGDGSVDRSKSLYKIGAVLTRRLVEEGINSKVHETLVETLRERDHSLGWKKYSDRPDPGEYERIATKIVDESGAAAQEVAAPVPPEPFFGKPILLGKIIREGVEPPRQLLEDVLLEGRVHHMFGAPGKGKTWIALHLAAELLDQGQKVMYLDMEDGRNLMAKRLEALGLDPGCLDSHLLYRDQISMPLGAKTGKAFERLLEEEKPKLVIFDSWVAFLAHAELEENDAGQVARWAQRFAMVARGHGISVLLIDHIPHEGNRPRGSSRKSEVVDVQWGMENRGSFNKSAPREIYLSNKKDREGGLPARVEFTLSPRSAGGLAIQRRVEVSDPTQGLGPKAQEILGVLEDFPGGVTSTEWRAAWKNKYKDSPRGGARDSTFYNARKTLLGEDGRDPCVEKLPDGKYRKVS